MKTKEEREFCRVLLNFLKEALKNKKPYKPNFRKAERTFKHDGVEFQMLEHVQLAYDKLSEMVDMQESPTDCNQLISLVENFLAIFNQFDDVK